MGDLDFSRVGGEGLRQCRDEGGRFAAAVDVFDDVAVVGPQHAPVIVHLHAGDLVGRNIDHP